ncbi:hypothetical protein, partial [Rodentibacter sp. Ppn85]|uniref:hypothetical protein n=1 Tax=Rodentibacter sp. Ppn85 TaxID=1908525 RepID=UPI0013015117
KTQWRTFYGKKTPGYLPEFWVTYSTNADDPNCQESFNMTFSGNPVARKQYKEFKAEEENGGKTYVIRYPANYWIGKCEYRSYGGTFYLEEKSDDPRLNQDPYNNKNQYYRFTLIHGKKVVDFSIRSDDYLSGKKSERQSPIYLNQPRYDVFCFKHSYFNEFINDVRHLISCENYEEEKKHYINSFVFYTESYWNNTPDIMMNLKVSKIDYCLSIFSGENECVNSNKTILRGNYFDWEIKKEWFDDFYDEVIPNDRP